jgi:hypothetical protein
MLIMESNYIAGIVDGEGSILINKRNDANNHYSVKVEIPNTNLDLLRYIRNITKLGDIIKESRRKINCKIVYVYNVKSYEYKKFLIPILPYLVIKKRQAELMLQYISLRKANKEYPLNDEEIEIKENIYEEIKPLNKTGQTYLHEVEKFPKLQGNLKELTEGNYAYLAALVDGEGSLYIEKFYNKYYKPYIEIANTNVNLIHYIQMLTNIGSIYNRITNSIHKNRYRWFPYIHQMKDFLIKVRPYLKIKYQQCDLLLEYFQLKGERNINQLTNQEKITLELIYDEIKVLNERGLKTT